MAEKLDAEILGMGSGSEIVARLLCSRPAGRVALVKRELLGGECAYCRCIPFKTLLRPPEFKGEAGN